MLWAVGCAWMLGPVAYWLWMLEANHARNVEEIKKYVGLDGDDIGPWLVDFTEIVKPEERDVTPKQELITGGTHDEY